MCVFLVAKKILTSKISYNVYFDIKLYILTIKVSEAVVCKN